MKVLRFRAQDEQQGSRCGVYTVLLVKEGTKWAQVMFMDAAGIRVTRVPIADLKWSRDAEYSTRRAIQMFQNAGKRFGISRGAKQVLANGLKALKQKA